MWSRSLSTFTSNSPSLELDSTTHRLQAKKNQAMQVSSSPRSQGPWSTIKSFSRLLPCQPLASTRQQMGSISSGESRMRAKLTLGRLSQKRLFLLTCTTLTQSLKVRRRSSQSVRPTRCQDYSMYQSNQRTKNTNHASTTCKEARSTLRTTSIDSASPSVLWSRWILCQDLACTKCRKRHPWLRNGLLKIFTTQKSSLRR